MGSGQHYGVGVATSRPQRAQRLTSWAGAPPHSAASRGPRPARGRRSSGSPHSPRGRGARRLPPPSLASGGSRLQKIGKAANRGVAGGRRLLRTWRHPLHANPSRHLHRGHAAARGPGRGEPGLRPALTPKLQTAPWPAGRLPGGSCSLSARAGGRSGSGWVSRPYGALQGANPRTGQSRPGPISELGRGLRVVLWAGRAPRRKI